jgi:hypothetical protein
MAAGGEAPPGADAEDATAGLEVASAVAPDGEGGRLFIRLTSPLATHVFLTRDGRDFLPVNAAAPEVTEAFAIRQIVSAGRHLYSWASASAGPVLRRLPAAALSGAWEDLPSPTLPDGRALEIGSLAVFGDQLVAGLNDPERGFELWRLAEPAGGAPAWEPALTRGGDRFSPNAEVFALAAWRDALYMAAGPRGGRAKSRPWMPGGFELIRVYPDFTWDLIAGTPRITTAGLKIPLAGLAAGFDDFRPADFRCLFADDNEILLGSYEDVDGFRVWGSTDGESWSLIPHVELSGCRGVGTARFHPTASGVALTLEVEDPYRGRAVTAWLRRPPGP